jgi:hypothetical protein
MAKAKYVVFENDVTPVRDGMYQRSFQMGDKHYWMWARYEGGKWHCAYKDFYTAKVIDYISGYQVRNKASVSNLQWRGLAEKPEGM